MMAIGALCQRTQSVWSGWGHTCAQVDDEGTGEDPVSSSADRCFRCVVVRRGRDNQQLTLCCSEEGGLHNRTQRGEGSEYIARTMTLISCSLSIHDFIRSFITLFRISASVTS